MRVPPGERMPVPPHDVSLVEIFGFEPKLREPKSRALPSYAISRICHNFYGV